jgi:hypothetical protein
MPSPSWLSEQTTAVRVFIQRTPSTPHLSSQTELIMSNSKNGSEFISRRAMVTSTALALGVAAAGVAVTRADAQQKISQADAKYQDSPK